MTFKIDFHAKFIIWMRNLVHPTMAKTQKKNCFRATLFVVSILNSLVIYKMNKTQIQMTHTMNGKDFQNKKKPINIMFDSKIADYFSE